MKQLLIARHGNTFLPNQTPTRVGGRTDLPLVPSGEKQAADMALFLSLHNLIPQKIYTSHLQRTTRMAQIICKTLSRDIPTQAVSIFNEIDYGPDENKTEDEVVARIGSHAIKNWDEKAIVPEGWVVDPANIIAAWQSFAADFVKSPQTRILVITSNGIARFAPHLTGDFESFRTAHDIKIATGAVCHFEYDGTTKNWQVKNWNLRPSKWLEAHANT